MVSENSNEFGVYLKELREERGYTLNDLANLIDYSDAYISQVEKGRRKNPPSLELLKRLSDKLGVPYSRLLKKAGYDEIAKGQQYLELIQDFSDDPENDILETLGRLKTAIQADNIEHVKKDEGTTEVFVNEKNLYDLKRVLTQISKPVMFDSETLTDNEKEILYDFIQLLLKHRA